MSSKFRKVIRDPKLLVVLLMGFSSGLPFLLVGATLKSWMTTVGVDLKTIGFFALVRVPYTWKFLVSPIMDRYKILNFGRRRGWLLVTQVCLIASLLAFAWIDPAAQIGLTAGLALTVAFFSASQDIVVDAYRREILPDEELGLGSSLAVLGYRIGTLLASSGAFLMADHISWPTIYALMSAFMLVGLLTTVFCKEPKVGAPLPRTLKESVIGPMLDFFQRDGAWTIFAFVLLYKVGEAMASDMYNPFFLKLGFTNTEIGTVGKLFGVWAMIAGGIVGGAIMVKLKLYRALWIFGILQSLCLLLFSLLASIGHSVPMLAVAVGTEYFTSGMATAAFVAFIATQSNRRFTAVQYALLTSLVGIPQVLLGASTGVLAEWLGWEMFFVACALFTIPGLLMLFPLRRLLQNPSK